MKFIEFVGVIKRHKWLVIDGLLFAVLLATFSVNRLDGSSLVSRSQPVYETTAVVAIKPGAEINVPTPTPTATTVVPTASPNLSTAGTTTTAVTTTTVAGPPDDVIDSRSLYYAALSIKTAVVAPGFTESVRARVPTMDGSIDAVAALDTNTIRLVVDGSTPTVASDTMDAALSELRQLVHSYASGPAFRYTLESAVITEASTPAAVKSIKGPITVVLVFGVALVLLWTIIRAVDVLQLHRREAKQLKRAQEQRVRDLQAQSGNGDHDPLLEPGETRVSSP